LLSIIVTVAAAFGMKVMPMSIPASELHAEVVTQLQSEQHNDGHAGYEDCLYCHIAKTADLSHRLTCGEIHRIVHPSYVGEQKTAWFVSARTTPCQPRAPPRLSLV
jgi:hypothetical protein